MERDAQPPSQREWLMICSERTEGNGLERPQTGKGQTVREGWPPWASLPSSPTPSGLISQRWRGALWSSRGSCEPHGEVDSIVHARFSKSNTYSPDFQGPVTQHSGTTSRVVSKLHSFIQVTDISGRPCGGPWRYSSEDEACPRSSRSPAGSCIRAELGPAPLVPPALAWGGGRCFGLDQGCRVPAELELPGSSAGGGAA